MCTITFYGIQFFRDFKLKVVLLLLCLTQFSLGARIDKSPTSVREFKFYREIKSDRATFLINKKNFDVFYIKNEYFLKVNSNKGNTFFTFSKKVALSLLISL